MRVLQNKRIPLSRLLAGCTTYQEKVVRVVRFYYPQNRFPHLSEAQYRKQMRENSFLEFLDDEDESNGDYFLV